MTDSVVSGSMQIPVTEHIFVLLQVQTHFTA